MGRVARGLSCALLLCVVAVSALAESKTSDSDEPLATSRSANIENGRRIVLDRRRGMCLLCHSGPFPEERFQGSIAPSLAGAGLRWSEGQLRFRLIDSRRLNPQTVMPPYFRSAEQNRVARAFENRTILNAEEIEDVTAFLATLRD